MRYFLIVTVFFFVISCSNDDENQNKVVSSGLKIFSTSETHNGDFYNDQSLTGETAIEKADDFCNKSSDRPDDSNYKALIVDGVERDAISLTNWVLQPNTEYYRSYNNVLIASTNELSIFDVSTTILENSICSSEICPAVEPTLGEENVVYAAWTGIVDVSTYQTLDQNNCERWAVSGNDNNVPLYGGSIGIGNKVDHRAFMYSGGGLYCKTPVSLFCVEQP